MTKACFSFFRKYLHFHNIRRTRRSRDVLDDEYRAHEGIEEAWKCTGQLLLSLLKL